jgi:translation initiation factor IF-2
MAATIEIEPRVTVGTLADKLHLPVTRVITELMKNGVMATVNEQIDFDTAQIIVGELGIDVELTEHVPEQTLPVREKQPVSDKAVTRPPVVAVMGHVDHGKTSLLDAIRGAQVAKGEAGGITQHISAYQIDHKGRAITFLDTPGHEAFAAIREHGAQLTDLVILVVAADDGVKPQTIEAIRFARKASVKIIVVINKIDKDGSNPNHVKQQLAEHELLVEEWGGDTVVVEVSAKVGTGVEHLLDMILLVADVEDLRAEVDGPARGLVIESHVEQGRGPVANALVEQGTLKAGNFVVAGTTYGKVRNLEASDGRPIQYATPSTPVAITGFKSLPEFADEFLVVSDEKVARRQVERALQAKQAMGNHSNMNSNELIRIIDRSNQLQELNIILKADAQGSLTSVIDSLKALDTEEVAIRIVGTGVGAVSENDLYTATSSSAIIYGFNVTVPPNIKRLASRDKRSIRLFNVIYELIDDVKSELSNLLAPQIIEKELGILNIKAIFNTTKTTVICGGEVLSGKLTLPALARVKRGDEQLTEVEVTSIKRGPQDAKEVVEGEMCGISFRSTSRVDLQEGDQLELFTRETVSRQL